MESQRIAKKPTTTAMTRQEQLIFCRKCLNRKFNPNKGIICGLTDERATFEKECPDFKLDKEFKERDFDDQELITAEKLQVTVSPDVYEKLKMEQNLMMGIVSGSIAGLVGAILWGIITVATNFQIGFMALAIGAAVGFTIRKFGNGVETIFGIWGAIISLLSVLLGNFFSIIGFIANAEGLGYFMTLTLIDYNYLPNVMIETFSFVDLVFYGIAVYEGYRFSFRKITEKTLLEMIEKDKQ
jgi:hypothetical protein